MGAVLDATASDHLVPVASSHRFPRVSNLSDTSGSVDAPWTWSDGSSKAIVKWADGEPSNTGGSDRCATTGLATGQWFSSTCDRAYPYVCKAVPGERLHSRSDGQVFRRPCRLTASLSIHRN